MKLLSTTARAVPRCTTNWLCSMTTNSTIPSSALHHFKRYLALNPNGPHAKDVKDSIKRDEIAALTSVVRRLSYHSGGSGAVAQ